MRWWTAALIPLGCASPPPPDEPAEQPAPPPRQEIPVSDDEVCTVHCERAEKCGVFRDTCEADCPGRGRPIHKMRADFVYHLMLCLEGASCSALSEGNAWERCHEAIVKTLPVSKPLRKFCFESSRRAAQCGRREEADQIACLTRFRFNNDVALERALACMDESCAKIPGCMAEELIR